MQKKDLIDILNSLITPVGFKKKGTSWFFTGEMITKVINLQKSNYSNLYYINYGYILNDLPLGNLTMHVYNRLTPSDDTEKNEILFLLDLDTPISDESRLMSLKKIIQSDLIEKIQKVNTEKELSEELATRPHLNNIPAVVKNRLGL